MIKNAFVYRIAHWEAPAPAVLEGQLDGARFVACAASQPLSAGWVPPRGETHAPLLEQIGGHAVLTLCTETKAVPGSALKLRLDEKLAQVEAETGRRPKGKRAREIKEELVHELLPRAFPKRSSTRVWLDPEAGFAWVGAGSAKQADAVVTALVERLAGALTLAPLQTALSPATAMAGWLAGNEAPAGFSIDRECELKQPDSDKAAVRYARHPLDLPEIAEHIRQGKRPTRLAMTWNGRVSFVLTEGLAIKKIELLDVVMEGAADDGAERGFDADVAIATGELRQLLPDLIDALGGPPAEAQAALTALTALTAPTAPQAVPA